MNNPDNGRGRGHVPKVAQVKVRRNTKGGGNDLEGSTNRFNLTLELKEKVDSFPFTIGLSWTTYIPNPDHDNPNPIPIPGDIDIPSDAKPVIENQSGKEVIKGKCVTFKNLNYSFPIEIEVITVKINYKVDPKKEPIEKTVRYIFEE